MSSISDTVKLPDIAVEATGLKHKVHQQIGALTGLRFFAAFYVFTFHYGAGFAERHGASSQIVNFLHNGYLGVSVFFVLSGFILTYTYRNGVKSLRLFALARFARIYPVYLLALLIALPHVYSTLSMTDVIKVLGMVQSWGAYPSKSGYTWVMQAWTLSVEFLFYLCFPGLNLLLNRLTPTTSVIGLLFFSAIIVAAGTSSIGPESIRPDLPQWTHLISLPLIRLPEFILGMLFCNVFLGNTFMRLSKPKRFWDAVVALTLSLILLILITAENQPNFVALVSVLIGVLIYFLSSSNGIISRMLASTFMQVLGSASYALYLLQGPVREWIRILVPSARIGQIMNPIILISLSLIVFILFEKPARKIILSITTGTEAN